MGRNCYNLLLTDKVLYVNELISKILMFQNLKNLRQIIFLTGITSF